MNLSVKIMHQSVRKNHWFKNYAIQNVCF